MERFLARASHVSPDHPGVISKFIDHAREIEIDAVAGDGEMFCYAITEHVENAGVHSGDATVVLPPQRTYLETMRRIKIIAKEVAAAFNITGPFNIQFIAKDNDVKVIECNLRASRSFPFVSKVLKINFIDFATRLIMGEKVNRIDRSSFDIDYVGVKSSKFSYTRLRGSDPVSGVEMSSTGEVACLGDDFNEAFLKSMLSTGFRLPKKAVLLTIGDITQRGILFPAVTALKEMGLEFYATPGTAKFFNQNGVKMKAVYRPESKIGPNVLDTLASGDIDLVINLPKAIENRELDDDFTIRRKAVDLNIPLITNTQIARRFVKALQNYKTEDLTVKSWDEYC